MQINKFKRLSLKEIFFICIQCCSLLWIPFKCLLITGDADFIELVEAIKAKDIEVYLGRQLR